MSYFQDAHCHETLNAALALAGAGFAVFPCLYAKKEPATRRGFYDAITNPATIRRWFGGNFRRNLAVRTGSISGFWVLDEDALGAVVSLEERFGPLPLTLQVRTSRGRHFWWRTNGLTIAGRKKDAIWPGLEVKAEGGYVMAPPSIHPTGVVYEWINDELIAIAPEWLVELVRKPPPSPPLSPTQTYHGTPGAYGAAALKGEIDALAGTPRGGRNHQLNRASFSLHQLVAGGELNAGEVERSLVDAAIANGPVADPKDGLRSVIRTIKSGARAGLQHPRSRPNGGRP
jgi:Bifunctional DNA primase/polymerase, N-terminal